MRLDRYRRMRRFTETPEPSGARTGDHGAPIFVVQLHHASHRHYDFRLELDGVLKSWAVPKGPSFDPKQKRLAVEVEDHPLEYAEFEGVIPEGNYGAGDVMIFDRGTWQPDADPHVGLDKGHLHFKLHGEKLRGEWDLVRTGMRGKKPQWLLRKADDDEAGQFESDDLIGDPEAGREDRRGGADDLAVAGASDARIDAGFFEPELALRRPTPPVGDYLHEPKWDGYRLLAAVSHGRVRLWSRNGIEWTDQVPEVAQAVASLGADALRLDGELVAVTGRGKSRRADFNALQAALSGTRRARLRYVVFDVLHVDGVDFAGCTLRDRKRVLHALLEREHDAILFEGPWHEGDGAHLLERSLKLGHEGLVSKRADSPYRPGRVGDWIKVRATDAEELAVAGYTQPRGRRVGIGALIAARPHGDGSWDYAGRVGTGLNDAQLRALKSQLVPLERPSPTVRAESLEVPRAAGDLRGVQWVEPRITIEVEHHGHGRGGLLRQPSVKAIREDKRVTELDRDDEPDAAAVVLTHPERVVYPAVGLTKAGVLDYYERIAPRLLADLARRPLALVRCTSGQGQQCFFQKHLMPGFNEHVHGTDRSAGKTDAHVWIEDLEGLRSLVQMNVLELHAWGGKVDDLDRADRIVLDLDPWTDVPWKRVLEVALLVRDVLRGARLEPLARVSGKKGVHVIAQLPSPLPWDEAKAMTQELAAGLRRAHPGDLTDVMSKKGRPGKIFVDYLRNGRGATSIASWSLRNTPLATVAVPVSWAELPRLPGADAFDWKRALERRG
jgi:bifunctional non-homologous end joining protein LigD